MLLFGQQKFYQFVSLFYFFSNDNTIETFLCLLKYLIPFIAWNFRLKIAATQLQMETWLLLTALI